MEPGYLDLVPPLFEAGRIDEFLGSGQAVEFTLSPRSNSLAVYTSPLQLGPPSGDSSLERDVYTVALNQPPSDGERRAFVSDTSIIFNVGIRFAKKNINSKATGVRTQENVVVSRKLATDYISHIQDCWIHSMQSASNDNKIAPYTGDHYRFLYATFQLFQILYLPEEGIEDVPVGDDLLEWLNTHFIEPSTEEGDRLSGLERPWEDESFWPYLIRTTMRGLLKSCTFFFRALLGHPSENLQYMAEKIVDILHNHPRQRSFATEKEFFTTSRRWRDKVRVLRIELDRVPDNDRTDGFENWWENMSDILGILEGREDVLQRVCVDLGGSWKEIICLYGIWVDVGMRRRELPEVVETILFDAPADPTDKEDALHLELIQGRPVPALAIAHFMDPWLPAHLVDIMTFVGLLDTEADYETGMSIRDYYVSSYADYLRSDPNLWRLTVNYLCTCGEIGMEMADEVLIRVPLELYDDPRSQARNQDGNDGDRTAMDIEGDLQDQSSDLSATVKELSKTCYEYQREYTRRLICQIAARRLVKLKNYGLAISYCRSAEDWTMLGHIVETVLEKFLTEGPSHYVQLVTEIAPSLPELQVDPGPQSIFVHRLRFAARYAEFHQRKMRDDLENALLDLVSIFEEDLAPRAWWGVLLYDAISFLQDDRELVISSSAAGLLLTRLEEVILRTSQGCGDDYLSILARLLKLGGPQEALDQLDALRLALARYLARCTLVAPIAAGSPSPHEL